MEKLLLLAMNGLIWGLIIALIALGLAIIFGLLDIINLAHGDFFMVGTVLTWATLQSTGSFWLAFIVAPLFGFILARISHTIECIGAANQRKLLCCNDLSPIRGAPRCPQSVPRISLGLNPLKDARW